MKTRYTISFNGETGGVAAQLNEFVIEYDLRKLVPLEKRGSKFLLKTAFYTGNFETSDLGAVKVFLQMSATSYRSVSGDNGVLVGIATPKECLADQFAYSYHESECIPIMLDYPETFSIVGLLDTLSTVNFPVSKQFTLALSLEEI